MPRGYDHRLYILPFGHRNSFERRMFGWTAPFSEAQIEEIATAKRVIYNWFRSALAAGVPREKAGVSGFIGFAVGRTVFWGPAADWRAGKIARKTAVDEIAVVTASSSRSSSLLRAPSPPRMRDRGHRVIADVDGTSAKGRSTYVGALKFRQSFFGDGQARRTSVFSESPASTGLRYSQSRSWSACLAAFGARRTHLAGSRGPL
jgi:hypothetical protein